MPSSTAATRTTTTTSAAPRRSAGIGIDFVDVGTSGGVWGFERGYCLMIGGEPPVVKRLDGIFAALAPGADDATGAHRDGNGGGKSTSSRGYIHCGPAGAGHFVKMVDNGIEYGLMAAYAEGLNILRHANAGRAEHAPDAETAPLRHPELYRYDLNLAEIAEAWRHGSVIGSWLLDLTAAALKKSPDLGEFAGRVSDSGEGRWTLEAAIDEGVPAPILSTALGQRLASRGAEDRQQAALCDAVSVRRTRGEALTAHPRAGIVSWTMPWSMT